jgi:hypothetical protein
MCENRVAGSTAKGGDVYVQPDATTVDQLVNAYQATLAAAREKFGGGLDMGLVVAAVTENARAARQRLTTEVPGGDKLTGRLDKFLEEAAKTDKVGDWINRAKNAAETVSKNVATYVFYQAVGISALPTGAAIVGAILTAILNATGALTEAGQVIGGGLAVVAAAVAALAAVNPAVASWAARQAALRVPGTAQVAAQWATNGFLNAVRTANNVGRDAEQLLNAKLAGPATNFVAGPLWLLSGSQPQLPGWGVASQVRSTAKTVLYTSTAIIIVCLLIIGGGILEGCQERSNQMTETCTTFYLGQPCP